MPSTSRITRFARVYTRTLGAIRDSYEIERRTGAFTDKDFDHLAARWAHEMFANLGLEVQRRGANPASGGAILVGNHVSYLDIPLLVSCVSTSFVAKQELSHWPVFGHCIRRAGIVLVKRNSKRSRQAAGAAISSYVRSKGRNVTVFPSGTTSLTEHNSWRHGVFRIAHQHGIPVQPFRLRYTPVRQAAYIDRDFFPWHLWNLLKGPRLKATLEFAPPRQIYDVERDCRELWEWSRSPLLEEAAPAEEVLASAELQEAPAPGV